MNEQPLNNQPLDRREARRARRAQSGGGWIIGIILIVLGGLFLAQDMGTYRFPFSNWWALFILIPAIGAFARGWRYYQESGSRLSAKASGAFLLGILLLLVTLGFLFNIDWTFFGPAVIILAGLGILFNSLVSNK
ncbi:MAG: LiaF transmembrane domain-containing protein [Chloroflexota bacterium]